MESQPLQTLMILRCVKVNLKDFKFDDVPNIFSFQLHEICWRNYRFYK